jgi:FkbM family methyltransferase
MGSTTEIIKVNTKKLETIFDENNVSHINYLSIDVEGAEFEVIKSINEINELYRFGQWGILS